jgi:hypothetical protein
METHAKQLRETAGLLENEISRALVQIAGEDNWWQLIDIFTSGMSSYRVKPRSRPTLLTIVGFQEEMLQQMFEIHSPKEPLAYGSHIQYTLDDMFKEKGWIDTSRDKKFYKVFFKRVFQEIERLKKMPNGRRITFNILMDLALEKLPKDSAIGSSKLRAKKQATILDSLEGLLPYRAEYWDLAAASRRVKSCMVPTPCNLPKASEPQWENDHNACLHNQLLGTLDILQRNAYFETRDKVWDAVEDRLPAEIIAKVFEQVLEAEEIPLDPRIIVDLKGEAGGQYRKNRFLCDHDRKAALQTS